MLQLREIVNEFEGRGIFIGSEFYVRSEYAEEFISKVSASNMSIIGVEGFKGKEGWLEPQLDLIADYSGDDYADWDEFKKNCNSAAINFTNDAKSVAVFFAFEVIGQEDFDDRGDQ